MPTLVAPQGVIDAAEAGVPTPAGTSSTRRGCVVDVHRDGVPPRRRGRRPDRHGHRQRRHAPRPEPARAAADGRGRDDAGRGARGDDAERRPALGVDDDLGTIEPGKLADLVVVSGDAYDVGTLGERVEQVWKAGARVV